MRKGFSLITAIICVVLVSTLAMFSINTSATTAKQASDVFLREQAELLAQGATEIATFNLLNTNFTQAANCTLLDTNTNIMQTTFPTNNVATSLFTVTVTVNKVFGAIGLCDGTAGRGTAVIPVGTSASIGTIILDVTVTSTKPNVFPVRYTRRTIQKL